MTTKSWHPAMDLHAIYAERYASFPKSPETFAIIYVAEKYNQSKDLWFPVWSEYVDRHDLAYEALLGNPHAKAIVSLFAFEDALFFVQGFVRFDEWESDMQKIFGNSNKA